MVSCCLFVLDSLVLFMSYELFQRKQLFRSGCSFTFTWDTFFFLWPSVSLIFVCRKGFIVLISFLWSAPHTWMYHHILYCWINFSQNLFDFPQRFACKSYFSLHFRSSNNCLLLHSVFLLMEHNRYWTMIKWHWKLVSTHYSF